MRSAAAEIAGESLFNLFQGRVRCLGKDSPGRHDHTVRTVPALGGLLGDESRLKCVRLFRCSKTFESCDSAPRDLLYGRKARAHGLTIDQHSAGAALAESTPEFCTAERERIAQNVKKRLVRIPGIDRNRATVYAEIVLRHAIIICQLPIHGDGELRVDGGPVLIFQSRLMRAPVCYGHLQ